MSAVLYREFTLRHGGIWSAVVAFVKANAPGLAEKGTPIRVIVTAEEKKRTAEANRYLWGVVYRDIAGQAWVEGRQYDRDTWHEYFADMFAPKIEIPLPDGRLIVRRKSTSEFSVGEFSTYTTQVQAYAANNLGVSFE